MPLNALECLRRSRAVIFDCDGVLTDSRDANCYFYNRIRKALGLPPMSLDEEDYCFVATNDEVLARIIPTELLTEAAKSMASIEYGEIFARIRVRPGALDFLRTLRAAGVITAADTNGGPEVGPYFQAMGLTGLFDMVVTAVDVARPKPDPEGVFLIMERFGLRRQEVVFIGDSEFDRQAARGAGVAFGSFANPGLEADFHLDDWLALNKAFSEASPVLFV